MTADSPDLVTLRTALLAADADAVRNEADRLLTLGAIPTAHTADELIALVLWHTAGRAREGEASRDASALLVEHLRAVAGRGQVWAMAWLGIDHYVGWSERTAALASTATRARVPALTGQERVDWLRRAASAGHRGAAAALGRELAHSENVAEALDWLTLAWSDGRTEPDPGAGAANGSTGDLVGPWRVPDAYAMSWSLLADTALEAAQCAASLDRSVEARQWFERAAFGDEWACSDTDRTRSAARADFARWLDEQNRTDEAGSVRQLLVDESARDSLTDARWMRSEHKTYRTDWQLARDRESARIGALRAELERSAMGEPSRSRLITLLCDTYYLGDPDRNTIHAHLATTPGGTRVRAQLASLLRPGRAPSPAPESAQDDEHATALAFVWWLLRDAQSSFLDLVGRHDEAEAFRSALDDAASAPTPWDDAGPPRGRLDVLRSARYSDTAGGVIRRTLLDGRREPGPRTPDEYRASRRSCARALGLDGRHDHREGPQRAVPLLRGTLVWMSLWLAGGTALTDALEDIGSALEDAWATAAMALRAEDPVTAEARLESHVRALRADLEQFAGLLEPPA